MKILFIHQNFPAQFKFLAPALVNLGHTVKAMVLHKTVADDSVNGWNGVKVVAYSINRSGSKGIHPWLSDFETKTIRAEAFF